MIISKPFSSISVLSLTAKNLSSSSLLPYSIFISHFSSSPLAPHHSYSHSLSDSKNVRVSVWWDIENCNVPSGVNVFRVAQAITTALRGNGIKGPVQITAFGDVLQLSRANQEALSSTGINLAHIPNGGKNSADRSLLVDLMCWVSQNPPPAHLFLISGDRNFASVLHRLRMNNYNILLAAKDTAPSVLCSAASIMWQWDSLVKGENLTGKHFNQPPDGPFASWYVHYKGPLEDPFAVVEQPTCLKVEDTAEASPESAVHPIPKTVMKQLCHILSSCPEGMSITDLQSELAKSNVPVDKDLYGYKEFSRFLLSMPHILILKSDGDGRFVACCATTKAPEPFQLNPCKSTPTAVDNGKQHITKSPKSIGEDISASGSVDGKMPFPSSPKPNLKVPPAKPQPPKQRERPQPPKQMERPPAVAEKAETANANVIEDCLPAVKEHVSATELGFFRKFWRRLFGGKVDDSELKSKNVLVESSGENLLKKNVNNLAEHDPSGESPQKKVEKKSEDCTSQGDDPVETTWENKTATSSELHGEMLRKSPGLFNRILDWYKFGGDSPYASNDQPTVIHGHIKSDAGKSEVFSKDSFWREMESFIDMKRGSLIISQSGTREQLTQNLHKEGPLVLRSLSESDVLQLVDMLISEKKWIEECPSEAFPFKLSRYAAQRTVGDSHASNGLSSIFMSTTGVPSPVSVKNPSERSRSEILGDCQKLVKEILKEFPGGYNMDAFRKLFLERYGYNLNAKKLSYPKLASLLQKMPGVKIESNLIIPCNEMAKRSSTGRATSSESELFDASKKDDELDSTWEELGERMRQPYPEYESPLSDDEFSDSEESGVVPRPGGQPKPGFIDENSSLLKMLDSWDDSKEEKKTELLVDGILGSLKKQNESRVEG
ncbi:NYN domain-containing protein/OST-HTH domain-containing [Salix suchowensis]|nr:NYN domain-containing protein/OST-HTH domain-containing [Salix suchowensis]